MKKQLFYLILFFLSSQSLFAQEGSWAVGLRGGISAGVSAKWYATPDVDFEVIASFRNRGAQLTGLAEFNYPLSINNDQWRYYYGGGMHFGFNEVNVADLRNPENVPAGRTTIGRLAAGPNLVAGIEFRPRAIPFTFSIDYKPYLDLLYWKKMWQNGLDAGVTIRYVF